MIKMDKWNEEIEATKKIYIRTYADSETELVIPTEQIKMVLDEEVSKPESNKGMVGWTIPSFYNAIDSINIPQYTKNMIKSECTAILHKQGLKVDVADYHDRVVKRLGIDDEEINETSKCPECGCPEINYYKDSWRYDCNDGLTGNMINYCPTCGTCLQAKEPIKTKEE